MRVGITWLVSGAPPRTCGPQELMTAPNCRRATRQGAEPRSEWLRAVNGRFLTAAVHLGYQPLAFDCMSAARSAKPSRDLPELHDALPASRADVEVCLVCRQAAAPPQLHWSCFLRSRIQCRQYPHNVRPSRRRGVTVTAPLQDQFARVLPAQQAVLANDL